MINKDENVLAGYIRNVTEEDRNTLPVFSHSRLECFENCKMNYFKKYIEKKSSSDTTIALQSGTLGHLLLELKGKMLTNDEEYGNVNYEYLEDIKKNGFDEVTDKSSEHIAGLDEIKKVYWETYAEADSEGRTYEEKWKIFDSVLYDEMENDSWEPVAFELPFEFVWDNKIIIKGFIDRVDKHGDQYRVVDYKSSKKIFSDAKIKTSQQMSIYACAIYLIYGVFPSQYLYRFIFIDDIQYANTKGWEKRFAKKMDKVISQLEECEENKIYTPSPSPLCYYCNYCKNNPNAHDYKNECQYYSLWTPTEKNFKVNMEFNPDSINTTQEKRKIVF